MLTELSRQESLATLQGAARGDLPWQVAELWLAETELLGTLSRGNGPLVGVFVAARRGG